MGVGEKLVHARPDKACMTRTYLGDSLHMYICSYTNHFSSVRWGFLIGSYGFAGARKRGGRELIAMERTICQISSYEGLMPEA